ncbi:MAG: hypothetical protein ACKOC5_20085, partial [Chloroflexota bacterium]
MTEFSPLTFNQRIGFHYFPDTQHYRQEDLDAWLPVLQSMGAAWIVLRAPLGRAIPEAFLSGLLRGGLQPVLHFADLSLSAGLPQSDDLRLLVRSYARWGIQYVCFFDRPNSRAAWDSSAWMQGELVEQFLDRFIPLAGLALDEGLTPVFPPLEPGGDYWDLSFLRAALRGLQRRGARRLLEALALSAEAWGSGRELDWGLGGPQRWPGLRPYSPPRDSGQDQRGFRIYDWYLAIAQAEIQRRPAVLLLRAGYSLDAPGSPETGARAAGDAAGGDLPAGGGLSPQLVASLQHAQKNLAMARCVSGEALVAEPPPAEVRACCFWLLAAQPGDKAAGQAWFVPGGEALPVVGSFRQWAGYWFERQAGLPEAQPGLPVGAAAAGGKAGAGAAAETAAEAPAVPPADAAAEPAALVQAAPEQPASGQAVGWLPQPPDSAALQPGPRSPLAEQLRQALAPEFDDGPDPLAGLGEAEPAPGLPAAALAAAADLAPGSA